MDMGNSFKLHFLFVFTFSCFSLCFSGYTGDTDSPLFADVHHIHMHYLQDQKSRQESTNIMFCCLLLVMSWLSKNDFYTNNWRCIGVFLYIARQQVNQKTILQSYCPESSVNCSFFLSLENKQNQSANSGTVEVLEEKTEVCN